MNWLVLLAALGLDRYQPLARPSGVEAWLAPRMDWLHDHLNAGARHHGWFAWAVGALLPAAVAGMASGILNTFMPPLAWALALATLYCAMGFQRVATRARDIVGALTVFDLDRARHFADDWHAEDSGDVESLARDAIHAVLRLGLQRLFAPIFWFALLGLFGVLLHALTRYLAERWRADPVFGGPARQVGAGLEWPVARFLGLSFAIVGNFEQALAGWRALPADADNDSVTRAAGAGALGVRLGDTHAELASGASSGNWDAPNPEYLEGALRLIWRALILWLVVFSLAWLAGR
jgi:adenosylcobinamide-phosphate synthase